MNPESSSFKDLPLDELSIVPEWARGPSKSFEHHTGQDQAERGRGRDRRGDRDRDRGPRTVPPRGDRPRPPRDDRPRPPQGDRPRPPQGERRPPRPGQGRPFKDHGPRRGPPSHDRHGGPRPPEPLPTVEGLDVLFVADPQAFDAMAETMKHTARAYPLFDVAKLVLYKPERHQVKLTRKPAADGTPRPLWRVTWDEQIFLSQHDAVQHVMRRFADRVYAKNQTPIDPPKGNFAFVNRCGFTDVWLGPPNYHEYQVRLVRHHQQQLPHVPFEKFKARIQTVRDPEAVQAWLTSMSSKTVFECQLCAENKPSFDDLGALEKHVVEQHLASCIESAPTFNLPGPASRLLAHRGISGTIRTAWESERRFPLNTVAALRVALGKHAFAYFKHDKNVTYITKIRRKRFETLDGLADNIRSIVLFLRAHPESTRKQLLEHFVGPVTPPPQPPPAPAAEVAASAEPAAVTPSVEPVAADAGAAAPVAEQPTEPQPAILVTAEDKILADLHWLITDGYVVEFSDGRLMAWPDAPPKPVAPETPAPAEAPATEGSPAEPSSPEPLASEPAPATDAPVAEDPKPDAGPQNSGA